MPRKPLSSEAEVELNAVLRRAAERMERRIKFAEGQEKLTLTGILAALDEQPRDE
jgi:hypothetical protein